MQIVDGEQSAVHALAISCDAALIEHTLRRRLHDKQINAADDVAFGFAAANAAAAAVGYSVAGLRRDAVFVGWGDAGGAHWSHARYVAIGIVVFVESLVKGLLAVA